MCCRNCLRPGLAVRACWDAYRKGHGRYEGEFYAIRQPVFSPGADDPWPAIPLYVQQYQRTMLKSVSGFVDNPAYPNVTFVYGLTPTG